jgi:hypothetical protein
VHGDVLSFAETEVKLKKNHSTLTNKYPETEAMDHNNKAMKKFGEHLPA